MPACRSASWLPCNTVAYECFIDELADRAKVDPVAYRRMLLAEDGRERHALDEAVAKAIFAAAGEAYSLAAVSKDGFTTGLRPPSDRVGLV